MICGRKNVLEGQDPETKDRCFSTLDDETHLIQYIATHRAKGGDGMNFDKTFWTAASNEMDKCTTQGVPKTIDACQTKWTWASSYHIASLHSTFSVVDPVATYSGWEYSLEYGVNITAESETVWTDYMASSKAPLAAKKFKNKGWMHYEAMKKLLPLGLQVKLLLPWTQDSMSYDEANILDQEEALNSIESPPSLPLHQVPLLLPVANEKQMETLSGKYIKSQCVAVPEAFQSMSKEIHNLSNSFDCATDVMQEHLTQVALHSTSDPIPVCKQKAIIQLQKEGLEDNEIIKIIKHFQADVAITDSYLVIEKESSIQKLFLSTYLQ
ncbi:uncharacterized protein EDB93DRAFT_1253084 [Suillus bovinus]|uniref:uncharacterized protein n=1 Tax=Suillus bovinus TaxID=48563 RepID=UPI001B85BB14|nr:uncharacterized protein EDB93DRAFT_1253084 [Suillus bovinus]KAG2139158.1 hypothetical protein EDB93DRAFT_1253084 [Suillus bovinus]